MKLQQKCHMAVPKGAKHRNALCAAQEVDCLEFCLPSLEPRPEPLKKTASTSPATLARGKSRCPKPSPTRLGRALITPSLPLEQGPIDGLQNGTWGKRREKGKGDHQGPLPIFSGLSRGSRGEGRLLLFQRKLSLQKWEGSTASTHCW